MDYDFRQILLPPFVATRGAGLCPDCET
jgi:hypothetical protein